MLYITRERRPVRYYIFLRNLLVYFIFGEEGENIITGQTRTRKHAHTAMVEARTAVLTKSLQSGSVGFTFGMYTSYG